MREPAAQNSQRMHARSARTGSQIQRKSLVLSDGRQYKYPCSPVPPGEGGCLQQEFSSLEKSPSLQICPPKKGVQKGLPKQGGKRKSQHCCVTSFCPPVSGGLFDPQKWTPNWGRAGGTGSARWWALGSAPPPVRTALLDWTSTVSGSSVRSQSFPRPLGLKSRPFFWRVCEHGGLCIYSSPHCVLRD